MEYEYQIVRSKRKTVGIEIDENCKLILRLPLRYPESSVPSLISRQQRWIDKHIEIQKRRLLCRRPLSDDEVLRLKEKARAQLPGKVKYYSDILGLKPSGIKITSAQKRFGSCSSKNSLCFSYILMQYPESAVDYVVVHELAHIRYKNHGRDFYSLIESVMPDYKQRQKLLKES